MSDDHKWFYLGQDDVPQGPLNREQLLELIRTGHAGANALVWRDGFSGWRPFLEVEQEIQNPAAAAAPAATPARRITPSAAALNQVAAATREVAAATKAKISEPLDRLSAAVRARPAISRTQLTVFASFVVAAVAIVTTLYSYSGPVQLDNDGPLVPSPTFGASLAQVEPIEAEPLPVRVKNPFDPSEVFEFPPGTDVADARNKVADLLLKRASERRATMPKRPAKVESRTKKKKRT